MIPERRASSKRGGTRQGYSFQLEAEDLERLRAMCIAAEQFHIERARYYRTLRTADQYQNAIKEEEQKARHARATWALLAGVRTAVMRGESPVGPIARDDLMKFLGISSSTS